MRSYAPWVEHRPRKQTKSAALVHANAGRRIFLEQALAGLGAMMAGSALASCGHDQRPRPGKEDPDGAGGVHGGTGGHGGDGGSSDVQGTAGAGGATSPSKRKSNLAHIGPLEEANADSLRLPAGFSSRVVARTFQEPFPGAGYIWHEWPDGGAIFGTDNGGWIYVSNSEITGNGGVGCLKFDQDAKLVGAYSILSATSRNCAGGATPWGTWLSCEEVPRGRVFECDPEGAHSALLQLTLGVFRHEAAAIDPSTGIVYLTEDEVDGRFYRFVPQGNAMGPSSLKAGTLQVAQVSLMNEVSWHDVPDPEFIGLVPTRHQVPESTAFSGGEGLWFFEDCVYMSTKGDNRVWAYETDTRKIRVIYDGKILVDPVLTGVDNLLGSCCGDILVAEDLGDMQIVAILADGTLKPLVQVVGHTGSEVTGLAFDPSGTRLYFSSQRGTGMGGITYEVTGPFHTDS